MTQGPLGFGDDGDPRDADRRGTREPHAEVVGDPGNRYVWIVGVAGLIAVLLIGINTLRNHGNGPGSRGPEVGSQARAFAAPLATSRLEGAVDVATKPDPGKSGKVPACRLHLAGAYNVCDAWARGPVAIVFFAEPVGGCVKQLDRIQSVLAGHPKVGFVAVAIRGSRRKVAALVRAHRLTFPVVFDEDGRLANLYGVAVCPQITYLRRGGLVAGTNIGSLGVADLERQLRALETGERTVVG